MGGALRRVAADRDLTATALGALIYSCALGLAIVALPLLALDAGYSKPAVGYLTALSAISQMGSRMVLGRVMRHYPDWLIVFAAGGLLTASCLVVAASAAIVPFAIAELLQGSARGCFWTGAQTHVVRGTGPSVRRLAMVNLISSIGLLAGPVIGGFVGAHSLSLSLYVAAAIALSGMVPPLLLDRLPPFAAPAPGQRSTVWRRPGVIAGSLAGITAGAWRGMLNSYVPVALARAGESSSAIGLLIAVANGTSIGGSALLTRVGHKRPAPVFAIATIITGAGTAVLAAIAGHPALELAALAVSGLGAGILQALGPAAATDAVTPNQRGDAIAVAGTYRAAALFAAPLGVGASLSFAPLDAAIAVTGCVISLPALLSRWVRPRPAPDVEPMPVARAAS